MEIARAWGLGSASQSRARRAKNQHSQAAAGLDVDLRVFGVQRIRSAWSNHHAVFAEPGLEAVEKVGSE